MNKTAIKNFAIWARNKLISDVSYRAGLMGITADGIADALPQSTVSAQFYDIGIAEPYMITGEQIIQRNHLVQLIKEKEAETNYKTAYKYVLEEIAYTWFNRLIAIRFMEVNDYLPSHIRVLSSENGKLEPDIVTTPFDADLDFSEKEREAILQLKKDNKLDEVFRILFVKQCNALNDILPALFEETADYSEALLNISAIDKDGVVYRLVNDIPEEDFNINEGGQVEIIGWLYQYYNTELNELVYDGSLSKERVSKQLLPAATTIYTPDWAIRYMVENSLGKIWEQGHPNSQLKNNWRYFIKEVEQEPDVQNQLDEINKEYSNFTPKDIKIIDPCMGSGHILVYAFDVLMQIYTSVGYSEKDAARSILENNIYGLDIDDRAYQMAYFAVMMKARQYNRKILTKNTPCNVHSIQESNTINRAHLDYLGTGLDELQRIEAKHQLECLLDTFIDAKEYGSILNVANYDWSLLRSFVNDDKNAGQMSIEAIGLRDTQNSLRLMIDIGEMMANKYEVVVTNPPYLGSGRFSEKLSSYVKENYELVKNDLSMVMYKAALDHYSGPNGFVAFITTSSWMTIASFEKLRELVYESYSIDTIVDFGTELFEGKVGHNPIVSWITLNSRLNKRIEAVRLVDYCYSLRERKQEEFFNPQNRYVSNVSKYFVIPGKPVAYWASDKVFSAFAYPKIENIASTNNGFTTGDNNTFLRLWIEVDISKCMFDAQSLQDTVDSKCVWFPYNKGGDYRKWYGNNDFMINWYDNGHAIKEYGHLVPRSMNYQLKASCSWSKITSGSSAFRYKEIGTMFDVAGLSLFPYDENELLYLLGLCNSVCVKHILKILSPTLNCETGHVSALPVIIDKKDAVDSLVKDNIEMTKTDWDCFETSWGFKKHPLV